MKLRLYENLKLFSYRLKPKSGMPMGVPTKLYPITSDDDDDDNGGDTADDDNDNSTNNE